MHGLKKIIISIVILELFSLLFTFIDIKKEKINPTEKKEISIFNEKEQKIIDTIYKKLNYSKYFDKENFKKFNIIELQSYGYYKSESNILYIRVNYNSECKDGTKSCDKLHGINFSDNDFYYFFIKIDIDTYDYMEVIDGISASIDSDWTQTPIKIK